MNKSSFSKIISFNFQKLRLCVLHTKDCFPKKQYQVTNYQHNFRNIDSVPFCSRVFFNICLEIATNNLPLTSIVLQVKNQKSVHLLNHLIGFQ